MRASRLTEISDMIVDLNEREISDTVKTDLCLNGAGAAGITIAREWWADRSTFFLWKAAA
jgi:ribulose 1,5-bisphosphate synthetase/thiazole synthase